MVAHFSQQICTFLLCVAIDPSWAISPSLSPPPHPLLCPLVSPSFLPLTPLHCNIHPCSLLQQPNCVNYLLSVQNC